MSENKKIEIVSGDDNDLEISPVRNHISPLKPKNIVIPKEKKDSNDDSESEDK